MRLPPLILWRTIRSSELLKMVLPPISLQVRCGAAGAVAGAMVRAAAAATRIRIMRRMPAPHPNQ
jgi:hypothetical protein